LASAKIINQDVDMCKTDIRMNIKTYELLQKLTLVPPANTRWRVLQTKIPPFSVIIRE